MLKLKELTRDPTNPENWLITLEWGDDQIIITNKDQLREMMGEPLVDEVFNALDRIDDCLPRLEDLEIEQSPGNPGKIIGFKRR